MIQDFFNLIAEGDPSAICILIYALLRVVLGVFELIATKSIRDVRNKLKGDATTMSTKFRLPDYQQEADFKRKGTTFTKYVPEYRYDEKTNQLVPTGGKIDVDELIKSHLETCFDAILEKFLPNGEPINAEVPIGLFGQDASEIPTELYQFGEDIAKVNQLREKYGFDDDMTLLEVLENIDKLNVKQKGVVETLQKKVDDNQIDVDEAIAFYKAHHQEEEAKK